MAIEVTGRRTKTTQSIIDKLRRSTLRLNQIQDIAGCRIVVESIEKQEKILQDLLHLFPNAKVVDRRAHPSNGYRAVHLIVTEHSLPVEIQLRTELQHLWAQLSERLADRVDPQIKYGGGPQRYRELLQSASDTVATIEAGESEWAAARLKATGFYETVLKQRENWAKLRAELAAHLRDMIHRRF